MSPPQTSSSPARMMSRLLHPHPGQAPYGPRGPICSPIRPKNPPPPSIPPSPALMTAPPGIGTDLAATENDARPPASPPGRRAAPHVDRPLGRAGPGGPLAQVVDAALVAGVVGEELGRAPLRPHGLAHPLPEGDRLVRVVAREGHQEDPDVVRLRLLHPAVRQAA